MDLLVNRSAISWWCFGGCSTAVLLRRLSGGGLNGCGGGGPVAVTVATLRRLHRVYDGGPAALRWRSGDIYGGKLTWQYWGAYWKRANSPSI